MYTLPDNAPDNLRNLLKRWQDISRHCFPGSDDLVFDELVEEHPGLFWFETIPTGENKFDMRVLRLGPKQKLRNPNLSEGALYPAFEVPNILSQAARFYPQTLESGIPHYWEMISNRYGVPTQQYVRLLLPLYNTDDTASSLLGSTVWIE